MDRRFSIPKNPNNVTISHYTPLDLFGLVYDHSLDKQLHYHITPKQLHCISLETTDQFIFPRVVIGSWKCFQIYKTTKT